MSDRVLVCGAREWTDRRLIREVLSRLPSGTIVIEGDQRGADRIAGEVAVTLGFVVEPYPADWDRYGRAAGPIRNQRMLEEGKPGRVIAFHADLKHSHGTKDMVKRARRAGLPVSVYGGYLLSNAEVFR